VDFINAMLGVPLGFIIYAAFVFTNSYGIAILIFSVVIKIVVYPITLLTHKNAIKFLQMQPAIGILKRRYAGEKEKLNEEQYVLFKEKKYNVMLGILPLIIQLVLIMGMLQVMYRPLQHLLRLDAQTIDVLVATYRDYFGISGSAMDQLHVLRILQNPGYEELFLQRLNVPNTSEIIYQISSIDLNFLGIDLGLTPQITSVSILWTIPILAGTLALIFCFVQNKISPGALTQSPRANVGVTIFTVGLSLYFAFVMPAGVGLYWALGNFFGMVVTLILNMTHGSRKLAGDAIDYLEANRLTPAQLKIERVKKDQLKKRSQVDSLKFVKAKKDLVFYALSGGQYKFYKNTIEYLLEHSNITIHYLTNDPDDVVFDILHERFKPYFATQGKTIALFLKLRAKMVVTTVPDLQIYHMKRSVVDEYIEYVHVVHGLSSTHMAAREKAYDYFDTIFCVGEHHVNEIKERVKIASLPKKKLVATGYGLYDQLVDIYEQNKHVKDAQPQILIAPSWQSENILESCIDEILAGVLGRGLRIIVRPHIQFVDMFAKKVEELQKKYEQYTASGELLFDLNFSSNEYIYTSDIVMTDWSGVAYEFSYCSLRPSIFINTPMKVLNQNYKQYDVEVFDIVMRDRVGVSVELDELNAIGDLIDNMLNQADKYENEIREVVANYLYHPNRSGEASAKYIMNRLEK